MIEIVQRPLFELVQETHQLLREKEALESQYIDVVVRIGQKLIAMRPYKPYGEFIPWLEDEFNISSDTAYNYMHVAEIYGDNSERVRNFPLRVVYEIASPKMPEKIREQVESGQIPATIPAIREAKQAEKYIDPASLPVLEPEPGPIYGPIYQPPNSNSVEIPEEWKLPREMRIETPIKSSALAALQSSDSNEWYTPAEYIEAARELMGAIDIDPASCEEANHIVKATKFYTKKDNGLNQSWRGRVWLNPPYGFDGGVSNQELWSRTLIERHKAGLVDEAVLLVNAVTGNKWFQPLWDYLICFTDHRIRFYNTEIEIGAPTHSNALIYFGSQYKRFIELFSRFGRVIREAKADEY